MDKWDTEGLSDRFRYAAESADDYVQQVRLKADKQATYQAVHDMHLGEFYVYNRLHGHTCLGDRESLLRELRRMRSDIPEDSSSFDHGTFARRYVSVTDALIGEFSNGAA